MSASRLAKGAGQATSGAPSRSAAPSPLQRRAEDAYALCLVAPQQARTAATAVISESSDDPVSTVIAMRALGLATRRLVGINEGVHILREAVRIGQVTTSAARSRKPA